MFPALVLLSAALTTEAPLGLHPDNPHYLRFRGRPTILVTSGEHYGAVLNLDFDHAPYLDELAARGFNLTRTFSGTYREVPGSFKIRDNTLAPRPGRYLAPWARVSKDGEPERFDLDRFDDAYFRRLKAFVAEAGRRGIVVELVLFCPLYEDVLWDVSPMNARNNVNGVGDCPRTEVLTLAHPRLVERQLAFVRKVVGELKDFDNLYYEICNEPYFGGVTPDWQARVAATIVEAEADFAHKHLIAQNIANDKARIETPNPAVSIFNFHYAKPDAAALNHGLDRPIGDDETGFRGTGDRPYRTEAWLFLLAGGSIFSNLDYSFTAEHEDGSAEVKDPTPGGGGPGLRAQLSALKRFLEGFDFLRMRPDDAVIKGGVPADAAARVLAERGTQYALYLSGGKRAKLELDIPAGAYDGTWLDPLTGRALADIHFASGGRVTLESPEYPEDLALRIVARKASRAEARSPRLPRLKVSENKRFLVKEDGSPFFYLGDTAWELFHRLDREETELYLRDRAAKGFTVIQAVALAEYDGLTEPNREGHIPLIDSDPARPNDAYFRHVDWVVDRAAALGMYVGLLPTWGDKVNKKWGIGPEVFTPENARPYGEFLGRRYRDKPILWILGGDRPVESDRHRAIWDAMAEGLRDGDGGRHLITYHPMGEQSSATWFHDAPWLDFHMIQSGHRRRDLPNHEMIARDYARTPVKPCLDGEPRYEDHPIGFQAQNGYFDARDVRQAAYWALFAGACGHTYGCHDIWQFFGPGHRPISAARTPWTEALKLPGSSQVQHARRLLESRPYLTRIPDQALIATGQGEVGDHVRATRDSDGRYALIYLPSGKPVTIDLGKLSGEAIAAWWFDPRGGTATPAGRFPRAGTKEFRPPAGGPDWVLVLDDAAQGYPAPGRP